MKTARGSRWGAFSSFKNAVGFFPNAYVWSATYIQVPTKAVVSYPIWVLWRLIFCKGPALNHRDFSPVPPPHPTLLHPLFWSKVWVSQAVSKPAGLLLTALTSWCSCLCSPSAGITGVHNKPGVCDARDQTQGFVCARQAPYPLAHPQIQTTAVAHFSRDDSKFFHHHGPVLVMTSQCCCCAVSEIKCPAES